MIPNSSAKEKDSICEPKQHPLYFTNPLIDSISKILTTFGNSQTQRIIYMGPRFPSTSKLFRAYEGSESRNDNKIQDPQVYGEEEIFKFNYRHSQKQKFYPVRSTEYRLFTGVNPTAKKDELRFDSNFQCGNLDLVVSLGDHEYDLFLRVDSNTKGHTCWFFFKVQNFTEGQKVKFNIANFSRSELSYTSGMKIYTYASSSKQWIQSGQNIKFQKGHRVRYVDQETAQKISSMHSLSFEYQFHTKDQFVYFAYCVPYSYSFLNVKISELQSQHSAILNVDRTNLSSGGLIIPVLTVTNQNLSQQDSQKQTCLIVGRLHPGETQGSWVLQGFLNYLCSQKAKNLRDKIVFKIIPMVNVDGVVAGNFRTNLMGRDLNRFFNHAETIVQIRLICSLASKLKPFMFLDFHGHSSRKNIFTYGPDYPIDHRYYLPCRIFPKIISKCSKSFRYHSCNFRLCEDKYNTGRGMMLKNYQVTYCFTIETSAFAYGSRKQEVIFDIKQYLQSGSMICLGLNKFVKIILAFPKQKDISGALPSQKLKEKTNSSKNISAYMNSSSINELNLTNQNKQLLQQILNDEIQSRSQQEDGDSDFQQGNDYSQRQLFKLLKDPDHVLPITQKKNKLMNHEKLSANRSFKNHSLNTGNSNQRIKLSTKYSDDQDEVPDYSLKKMKKLNIYKNQLPQLQKNYSQSLKLNFYPILQAEKQKSITIKEKYIKHLFSEQTSVVDANPIRLQNLNQLSLDYSVNKSYSDYEPLSDIKRLKDKQSIFIKKRRGQQKQRNRTSVGQQEKSAQKSLHQIKKSLFPLLGRNSLARGSQSKNTSIIQEMFQKRQLSRQNRLNKQIRIFYF